MTTTYTGQHLRTIPMTTTNTGQHLRTIPMKKGFVCREQRLLCLFVRAEAEQALFGWIAFIPLGGKDTHTLTDESLEI